MIRGGERERRWKEEWQWATYCIDLVKVEGWDVFGRHKTLVYACMLGGRAKAVAL